MGKALLLGTLLAAGGAGCKGGRAPATIHDIGSDTMINLAASWAEAYARVEPGVSIEVSGGGSGVGIAALIDGTADVANASRRLAPEETERARATGGPPLRELLVGYDGVAIYVHRDNPLATITVEQLEEIYREGGTVDRWSQLGAGAIPGAKGDTIVRVSRQNNSGTYASFREVVLEESDFKPRSMDMNGSKEVIETVGRTPNAIGYGGLGYATPAVKVLAIAGRSGGPPVAPSVATVLDESYPLARPLYLCTPGDPSPAVTRYLAWIQAPGGQRMVEASGYVPLPKS